MTSDEHSTDTAILDEPAQIIRAPDGAPLFAVLEFSRYLRLTQFIEAMMQRLENMQERFEDALDAAELADYVQRRAHGELTEDERETISLDDLLAELKPGWSEPEP